jgi:hypothetical protein
LNRWFNLLVIVFGTAAFGDFMSDKQYLGQYFALGVAIIGALQLVWDFGGQARDHQVLQRAYYGLLAEIEASHEDTAERRAEWWSAMIRITADEPPTLRARDAKAYNDAVDGLGSLSSEERLVVPLHHRLVSGVFSFEGHNYLKRKEVEERKAAKLLAKAAKRLPAE